jgi:quercetin dioxygenase-like cupin family protein
MKTGALKYSDIQERKVTDFYSRRVLYTDNLMMVNCEFTDGPTENPDPFHSHPHEQVSFMAEGEVYFFCGDNEKVHLKPGDHFSVPSGVPHTIHRLTSFVRIIDCFTPLREDFLK